MAVGIKVQGLRETVRSLERFGVDVQDLKAAFKRIGSMVATEAQGIVPRRSGSLAGSIRASNTKNRAVVRAGGAKVPYAGVIEYGWPGHGIEPHPYLRTAVNRKQAQIVPAMEQELNDLMQKYGLN